MPTSFSPSGSFFPGLRIDDRNGSGAHHRVRQPHHVPMRADQDGLSRFLETLASALSTNQHGDGDLYALRTPPVPSAISVRSDCRHRSLSGLSRSGTTVILAKYLTARWQTSLMQAGATQRTEPCCLRKKAPCATGQQLPDPLPMPTSAPDGGDSLGRPEERDRFLPPTRRFPKRLAQTASANTRRMIPGARESVLKHPQLYFYLCRAWRQVRRT
jgi:hypothetical protein